MPERFQSALTDALRVWRIEPSEEQVRLLEGHFKAVLEANRRFNLTRVTEPVEAAVTLYADSVSVAVWAVQAGVRVRAVLDGGTGAGFPAVPVAVMQPRWQVTAADSTAKKADFVSACARDLRIRNLTAVHSRVEHLQRPPVYELVLFKAVSKIDECLTWSQHVVARGGHVVLYKTPTIPPEEEAAGQRTAGRLGYREVDRFDYALRHGGETLARVLRVFRRE
ncbi:MAG: 16S rRNA (guanine(527)-N(7))-methyltransferase RsmG [Phycisphaerales bacterium]|nr:MAG: 16S rRNA (guanine(527)-N(7))-methyltransferase RsmG [Phycisphaerales bacterium]